jgi:ferredoxin
VARERPWPYRQEADILKDSQPRGPLHPFSPGAAAFLLTAGLLTVVQLVVIDPPGLLLERFWPGGGWLTILVLASYAAVLAGRLRDPRLMRRTRPWIWALFSLIFFLQLGLGLLVNERFLMTGRLHLPIPALIVAGPLYRGAGFFMPILMAAALLLVGPAWCSWLCYLGAWDDAAARRRRLPVPLPAWRGHLRLVLLVAVALVAFALGRTGVPPWTAGWLAAGFGLMGVAIMLIWSRRTGAMVHCTSYCPIGFVATRLGKLSPFRIRIDADCSDCGVCTRACRYDALSEEDVLRRHPGEACTLCGDCVTMCHGQNIDYRFAGLAPDRARLLFVVLVVSLHAAFLGVARI